MSGICTVYAEFVELLRQGSCIFESMVPVFDGNPEVEFNFGRGSRNESGGHCDAQQLDRLPGTLIGKPIQSLRYGSLPSCKFLMLAVLRQASSSGTKDLRYSRITR